MHKGQRCVIMPLKFRKGCGLSVFIEVNGERRLMSRLKFLDRYKPIVIKELSRVKGAERGGLSALAKKIDMDPSRLSELLGGRRNLTSEYVIKMVGGGFLTVDQLLRGRDVDDLGPDEKEFIDSLKIVEDREWMQIITNLKRQSPEVERMAKEMLKGLVKKH